MTTNHISTNQPETSGKGNGGPAFPVPQSDGPYENGRDFVGVTLRDYFAAAALGGMLASPPIVDRQSDKVNHAGWAQNAYRFADAMLVEREN